MWSEVQDTAGAFTLLVSDISFGSLWRGRQRRRRKKQSVGGWRRRANQLSFSFAHKDGEKAHKLNHLVENKSTIHVMSTHLSVYCNNMDTVDSGHNSVWRKRKEASFNMTFSKVVFFSGPKR